jgi:hypothetical protein
LGARITELGTQLGARIGDVNTRLDRIEDRLGALERKRS